MGAWPAVLFALLSGAAAAGVASYIVGRRGERRVAEAAGRATAAEGERLLEAARQRVVLTAKEELLQAREASEQEATRRRRELERREQQLDERAGALEERDRQLQGRDRGVIQREQALASDIKEQAKRSAEREAKTIVALAIQRIAADHTAETTVSAVALPTDEMKGRIIGREGRNIRAFEAATGVDVIIDDTPDTVVVSCFDPVRREVARLALERLITDGRIHPGRIEEVVDKARAEVEASIVEAGEQAVYETGIKGMHPELVKLVGRMRYRTSYGQNILEHSKEVAWLAGIIAT